MSHELPQPKLDNANERMELSSDEQKVFQVLEGLAEEKSQMAIRVLCAGAGKERGSYSMAGISFELLGNPGDKLETIQLQITSKDGTVYNFGSFKDGYDDLAKDLVKDGLTPEQIENFAESVRGVSPVVEKQGNTWVATGQGSNSDQIMTFEDLLK